MHRALRALLGGENGKNPIEILNIEILFCIDLGRRRRGAVTIERKRKIELAITFTMNVHTSAFQAIQLRSGYLLSLTKQTYYIQKFLFCQVKKYFFRIREGKANSKAGYHLIPSLFLSISLCC